MSDDFFERYKAYDGADQQPSAAPQPADADYAPIDSAAPQEPYVPHHDIPVYQPYTQPVQPVTQLNTPTSAPAYGNPYAETPRSTVAPAPAAPVNTPAPQSPNTSQFSDGYYHRSFTKHEEPSSGSHRNGSKKSGGISKGVIAALLIACMLISAAAGFGGSLLADKMKSSDKKGSSANADNGVVYHTVDYDSADHEEDTVDKSTSQITDDVADSVVEITTEVVQTSRFYGQYIVEGAGSGVIINENGTIITNNHVIEGSKSITVTLRSGESYEAQLVGTDEELDIALIKIDADVDLKVAVMGDSDKLNVGDKSVIIGNPLGTLGGSVTEGIISALDRSIVVDGKTMTLMQTDAAINAGNSGGGMFNGQGELVGIVVAKNYSGEVDNIGFVIPINNAKDILQDLQDYGYVRGKADTGMTFMDVSNSIYAWYYYGTTTPGCYISSVESGSNAQKAGFEEGYRVISVDGTDISESADIKNAISGKSVGDEVEFEVEDRRGNTETLTLMLEEKTPE